MAWMTGVYYYLFTQSNIYCSIRLRGGGAQPLAGYPARRGPNTKNGYTPSIGVGEDIKSLRRAAHSGVFEHPPPGHRHALVL